MAYQGILIDVDFCTGCQACVLACQQEHGFDDDTYGLQISQLGPLKIGEAEYQYDYIPQFTKWCDLCEHRVGLGKVPSCVQHCQSQCLDWGAVDELARKMKSERSIVVGIKKA